MSYEGLGANSIEVQQIKALEEQLQDALRELNTVKSAYSGNSQQLISQLNAYYQKRERHLKK